jgi:tRNA(fMet)-specific endonuclease VapC
MPCLETDFLVALIRKDKAAISKLKKLTEKNLELSITPITLTELFYGAFKSGKEKNILMVEEMVSALRLLDFDFFACKEAGRLLASLEKQGKKIGDFDTITGAIASWHGQKLLTKNIKHFKQIDALETESW